LVNFLLSKKARIDCVNNLGQTPIDLICNIRIYKIYLEYHEEEKLNQIKCSYSRLVMNNCIFHNNRVDNIRDILSKCERNKLKQRKNLFDLDRINNYNEFKVTHYILHRMK